MNNTEFNAIETLDKMIQYGQFAGNALKILKLCKTALFERDSLASENAKLRELLALAIQDMLSLNNRPCELCKYRNATWIMPKPCKDCDSSERNTTNWQWQHADKLKELGISLTD